MTWTRAAAVAVLALLLAGIHVYGNLWRQVGKQGSSVAVSSIGDGQSFGSPPEPAVRQGRPGERSSSLSLSEEVSLKGGLGITEGLTQMSVSPGKMAAAGVGGSSEGAPEISPEEVRSEDLRDEVGRRDFPPQGIVRPAETISPEVDFPGTDHPVEPEEYLSLMARRVYGVSNDTVLDLIHMANPHLSNVNLIFARDRISFPRIGKKALIVADNMNSYYIHYASFYDLEEARRGLDELTGSGRKAFIMTALQGDAVVYRVYAGVYSTREEAERDLSAIDLKYLPFLPD